MIAKVVRGWRPAGLVAYLFGPGRFEEHRDPRVAASWDGAPWVHQPEKLPGVALDGEVLPAGEFDFELKPLVRSMRQVADWSGLPTSTPRRLPAEWADRLRRGEELPADAPAWARQYRVNPRTGLVELRAGVVWHCSVRLHPDDPVLDDARWETIAVRLMRATRIDQAGCRWMAVRHADDHIHLMAVLVSERTGRRVEPFRDFVKLRAECRAIERDLGLVSTAPIDRTAAPAPTRAEKAKAVRLGQSETVREELRRIVEQCAAATHTETDSYYRAARTPHHVVPTTSSVARELRHAARQLASVGHLGGRSHAAATAALLLALASLVAEIAAWQQHHGRTHQAGAADISAQALAALAPPGRAAPSSTPSPKAALPGARPTTWRPGSQSYDPRSTGRRR